jgi:hypothetical protein
MPWRIERAASWPRSPADRRIARAATPHHKIGMYRYSIRRCPNRTEEPNLRPSNASDVTRRPANRGHGSSHFSTLPRLPAISDKIVAWR